MVAKGELGGNDGSGFNWFVDLAAFGLAGSVDFQRRAEQLDRPLALGRSDRLFSLETVA